MELILQTDRSELRVYRNFIDANKYYERALALPLIEKPPIVIQGRVCHQQRNVGFFAKSGVQGYRYSGQQTSIIDITQHTWLEAIMQKVNRKLQSNYNGILINLYENGHNYISAHSDDERDLDLAGVASIAIGAVRIFRIRDKQSREIIVDVEHQPGDLLVMYGDFQKEFLHEIPQQKKIIEPRVSLTFRKHRTK